jgi:hypothetical protein
MSKIVQAVNAMISNPDLIGSVMEGATESPEVFFLYNGRHKWSMRKDGDGDYHLFYYPGEQKLEQLARMDDDDWQNFREMAHYSANQIGTREAKASFRDLYNLLNEKVYGLDEALTDIIDTQRSS